MASNENETATVAKSGTSFATPFASGAVALTLEGLGRAARLTSEYEELYELFLQYPPVASEEELLDLWLPRIATKPAGVVSAKDDDYGWGLPLGSLVAQALGATTTTTVSDMLSAVTPLLGIGIVGMMMGGMAKAIK
jgi:subtilisin family serine protease